MYARSHLGELITALMFIGGWACGGVSRDQQAGDVTPNVATSGAGPATAVKTAPQPASACDWLTKAEVAAILGPLAGPPRGGNFTCRYPLPMDSATAQRRVQYKKILGPNASGVDAMQLDTVAVIVQVDLRGNVTGERAGRMAGNMLGAMFNGALSKEMQKKVDSLSRLPEPQPPEGWDVARAPIKHRDFTGRIGHVTVTVDENVVTEQAVAAEKKAALAALVRDRIPDLPFQYGQGSPTPVGPPPGPDPCSLLTREEAESVLGKLVVAPYRSHDGGPYLDDAGLTCAYYTAGHHVLVIIPHWTDGKRDLRLVRGIGNLVSSVAADKEGEAADTLDGPWDDVTLGLDGNLAFLKGDRLLEIAFATSSTGEAGAMKLARIALARLAAAGAQP